MIYGHKGTILVESTKVTVTPEVMIRPRGEQADRSALVRFPERHAQHEPPAHRQLLLVHAHAEDPESGAGTGAPDHDVGDDGLRELAQRRDEALRSGKRKKRTKKADVRKGYEGDGKNYPGVKLALHRACIAKLFEDNKQVLDAENIFALAKEMA